MRNVEADDLKLVDGQFYWRSQSGRWHPLPKKLRFRDGVFYRKRRDKWVAIPPEWVGVGPTASTIRGRASKQTRKIRRRSTPWGGTEKAPNRAPRHTRPGKHRHDYPDDE